MAQFLRTPGTDTDGLDRLTSTQLHECARTFLTSVCGVRTAARIHRLLEQNEMAEMELLRLCSDADLAEIGIRKGPRIKILHALSVLKPSGYAHTPMPGAAAASECLMIIRTDGG